MPRFNIPSLFFALGLVAPVPALAANFCVAVNGGFGGAGGTSFVGTGFALPVSGICKPWSGFTKTATTVIAFATGTGCLSSTGKVLTLSISNTDPDNFGAGVAVSDQIRICPTGTTGCPITGSDQGNFAGSAAEQICTANLLKLPVVHD
jgi:hypothetical protein